MKNRQKNMFQVPVFGKVKKIRGQDFMINISNKIYSPLFRKNSKKKNSKKIFFQKIKKFRQNFRKENNEKKSENR